MAVFIDPPRWPAWGTTYSHLVSDFSLDELHDVAARAGVDPRAFDHDHYDVAAHLYDAAIEAGAEPVRETDLVRRLVASGLRVRASEKAPTRQAAVGIARGHWARLGLPGVLRDDLLARWGQPQRHYHDVRHLAQVLTALDELGQRDPVVALAAWFHDAVYDGAPGDDEENSALLAGRLLAAVDSGLTADDIAEVSRLVRMTASHRPGDTRAATLSDADLSILGQIPGRYHVYRRDVRLDYAHLPDEAWREGREQVLKSLLARDRLFHTDAGRARWEAQARANIAAELAWLNR